ncbi:hypothetical protein TTHERM_00248400 (macronuclear) [Tetrahymena thermophila SB210]|uniref:Uncharacterized protein n=1 Tax=Tetrahymena thermophila (strain SB210) TaxID=312017 RepID=Q245K8_TETTS|nr:hypothetical protein TTHERM_00248400 [Tetrahymena thermophila SB210]EAS03624.1 hypothetical protein TTHERM_00248400 [Tetrahymena thermophila SB210]|eukprot:XP_001023870.1 hypothetical protein TTHERM_00248400 [Tetrahymena thermophila SB210]
MSKYNSPKKKQKRATISSISSIKFDNSEQRSPNNGQFGDDFVDFEDYDLEVLNLDFMYRYKNPQILAVHQRDSEITADEIIRKLVSTAIHQVQENELNMKIPYHSIKNILNTVEVAMNVIFLQPEDNRVDFATKGLQEDVEPQHIFKDTWLRSKVHVDTLYREEEEPYQNSVQMLPHSKVMDIQSKRRSSKASSVGFQLKKNLNDQSSQALRNLIPAPIDLTEPLNISITEEKLRQKKENERKEREEKAIADNLKRQNLINEEQQKFNKFQKENKAAGFTYDYNGELLAVQKVKINKLPPSAQTIQFGFKEDDDGKIKDVKKKKKVLKSDTVNKFKKAPEQEKEFAKMITNQPPILDNIPLSQGVALLFEGRKRVGPRPNTVDMQSLTLTGGSKVRMGRKQYDEIIKNGGFNRGKIDQNEQNNRLLYSAGDPRFQPQHDENQEMNTIDRLKFLQKIQNQTTGTLPSIQKGSIKIQSAKIYETLTQTIDENEEIELKKLKELEAKKKEGLHQIQSAQLLNKSPVDEFNLQITRQSEWGKSHYGSGAQLMQYNKHKPTEKDLIESLGKNKLKPRERLVHTPNTLLPVFDLRASTSEGFFRKNVKTSESNRLPTGNPNNNINNNSQANNSNVTASNLSKKD